MSNETKKTSVHADLAKLEGQIIFNKWVAWILVGLGGIAAGWGLWIFRNDLSSKTDLSSIGSYFQGAVGSLWALAGLMFIYVAFLGQKQQLLLQREAMEFQKTQFDQEQADKAIAALEQSNELLPSGVRFQRPERGAAQADDGSAASFSIDPSDVGAMGFYERGNFGLQANRTHGRL